MNTLKALRPDMDRQEMGNYFAALVEDLHNVRTEAAVRGILVSMCEVSLLLGSSHADDNDRAILILRAIIRDATTDETVMLAKGLVLFHRQPRPGIGEQELLTLARNLGLTNK